jgi:hypothetical protein
MALRVDWVKNLVLSLVGTDSSKAKEEDPDYEAHFKSMIAVVLQSITAAKHMIMSSQFDNGEDDDAQQKVPASVHIDLQLLEYVIKSSM